MFIGFLYNIFPPVTQAYSKMCHLGICKIQLSNMNNGLSYDNVDNVTLIEFEEYYFSGF